MLCLCCFVLEVLSLPLSSSLDDDSLEANDGKKKNKRILRIIQLDVPPYYYCTCRESTRRIIPAR